MALVLSSSSLTVPPSPTIRIPPPFPSYSSSAPPPFIGNIDLVQQWDEATVGEWLKSVNCGKYRAVFAANNINGDALLDCDQTILKEVGVTKVGDRIRIMVAVKALRTHAASVSRAARMEGVSSGSPVNGSYSPTTTFGQFQQRSGNNSATSSPALSARTTLDATMPNSPGIHESSSSRLNHKKSVPSIDGGGIMSIDHVRQNCAKFIGEDGQTRIVAISDCASARAILNKVLKKFNIQDDQSNWCIFITKERGGYSRLTDAELLQYCHDPTIPERERLILTKRNTTPGGAELRRAQAIAKEQALAAHEKILSERKDGSLGRTRTNKLEGFFGERPTSFQRPPPLPTSSSATTSSSPAGATTTPTTTSGASPPNTTTQTGSPRDQARPNTKRLKNFFGQRPPSELISSNLAEYFPDHEKNVLEETVRNSIRRSTRYSQAGRRFSTATTASTASSRDKDIPPLPMMADTWKDSASTMSGVSGTATPPRMLPGPRPQTRPLSMRRAVTSASYANSIVESLAEEDSEDDEDDDEGNEWSVVDGGDTLRPSDSNEDTLRPSAESTLDATVDAQTSDKGDEEEEEDSEEEYEEGEFDAVGGGPTRWIRGALIGMGSFGSVYLGMNRTSGELMAVKQVELPSHEVQGEQRKQSMLIALQREIALLRDLTHENIVHYIGSSTDDKFLNIFLEYVPGGSVVQLLSNYGPFEEPLVRNFVRQILAGLNYLHERDIIHRDIKGANVLVDNKGVIKISDFGISKKVEANLLSTAAPNHPHRPSLQGSVYWMAPEVVKQTSYTRKADIWSLGCLVVEMFTGSHPFPDFSQMQAIFKIGTSCSPDIPEQSSDDAKDFLNKTFELDHHNRPSASELMDHPFLALMDEKSKSERSSEPSTPTKAKMDE